MMQFRTETIGDCTLYLGNCLEVMPHIDPVDHVMTDPPYEAIMHQAKAKASQRKLRTDGKPEIQSLDFDAIDDIRDEVVSQCAAICSGWLLAFCSPEGVGRWANTINASDAKYKRACVWIKPDAAPQMNGQGPAMGAENFVVAWCGTGYAKWNAGGKRGVYTHCTNAKDRDRRHPTEKPWRLMAELINDFTNPDQLILDPFMGSGTTGVACVKQGRRFIGIEKSERYFDIACERISAAQREPDMFLSSKKTQVGLFDAEAAE
ncbi:DNA-methyltransferase [Thalassospira lohafexi]|nr:DNA methyltransferase [Thalassospira lohafexi]